MMTTDQSVGTIIDGDTLVNVIALSRLNRLSESWSEIEEVRVLAGKRVVVTGASRGLGRAFAEACAKAGARVVVNGQNELALADTQAAVEASGGQCEVVAGSVADYDVCERIVQRSVDAFGGIDCLVNNAGITRDRTLGKMSKHEFDEVVAVNLAGSWACGKFAAAAMKESGGSIVNVISNTAFSGAVGQSNYGASKAGVAGMTRTWTRELSRYAIRVNAIWPIAATDMTAPLIARLAEADDKGAGADDPLVYGFGDPKQVADIVVFLASDRGSGITGQMITFNGRKLALWNHPSEVAIVHRDAWSPELIAQEFESTLGRHLQDLYDAF